MISTGDNGEAAVAQSVKQPMKCMVSGLIPGLAACKTPNPLLLIAYTLSR